MRNARSLVLVILLAGLPPAAFAENRGGSAFVALDRISVSPVPRESGRLVDAGEIATGGAKEVVLNLLGEISGKATSGGEVGALLVPAVPELAEAIRNRRGFPKGTEVVALVPDGGSGLVAADQVRAVVGFPRYRVFLWNSSDTPIKVSVFAYLTD